MPTNPEKMKQVKDVSIKAIVFALARNSTGKTFIGTSEFKVAEIDLGVAKPEPKDVGAHASYVSGLAAAGPVLVSGGWDGKLIWWDTETKKQIRSIDAHQKWIRKVRASRDGRFVVSVADDMVGRVWEAATGKLLHELRGHAEMTPHHFPSMLHGCAIAPDNRHVATADKTGRIIVWDAQSGAKVTEMEAPVMYTWDPVQRRHSIGGPRGLAFSPDGVQLAVGGIGKIGNIDHLEGNARVEVFDWKAAKRTHEFPGDKFKGIVNHLEFHPKGEWLLAAGGAGDGFVMFFDLKANKAIKQDKVPMHVHDFLLSGGGESLVLAGHQRIIGYEMKG
jgi:WD40 repeat protein